MAQVYQTPQPNPWRGRYLQVCLTWWEEPTHGTIAALLLSVSFVMLRAFFSRLRAALTTVLVSGAALCASAAEVTVGYVDLMEPGFFSQTVMSALTAVAQERKDDRVHSLRLSPMIALQEIRQRRPDIVISPAEIYINLATDIGAHPIAIRKTRYAKDPASSVAVQSLCGPIGRSCRPFRI